LCDTLAAFLSGQSRLSCTGLHGFALTSFFMEFLPMNRPRRAIALAFVLLLSTGYSADAKSSWSVAKLWPFQSQSAAKKKASAFQTTGYPKSSSRKSASSRWLPSLDSVTAAPKKLWAGTKKMLTPSSRKKASGRSSKALNSSRRHKPLSHRSSGKDLGAPMTMGDFVNQKRPGF
jgi:hypothetical protein